MRSLVFYMLLLVVVGGLFAFDYWIYSLPFAEVEISKLTPLQEKQLEMFRESETLLTTLATAAIGAVGALLFNRYRDAAVPGWQTARALGSVGLSCISLYCGYLAHTSVIWMLQNKFYNLEVDRIVWANRLQFWSFLISILVLADFFRAGLPKAKGGAVQ